MNFRIETRSDGYRFVVRNCNDPKKVIEDYLHISPLLFSEGFGSTGYYHGLLLGHIIVAYDGYLFAENTVCVVFSGQGIAEYEAMGKDFPKLNRLVVRSQRERLCHVTKLDLAADDKCGLLPLYFMGSNYKRIIRSLTDIKNIHDGVNDAHSTGQTLYIGSKKSDYYFRAYDKAKEMYEPSDSLYYDPWVQVELVLRAERAERAAELLADGKPIGELLSEILNGFMAFVDRDTDINISRCEVYDWWLEFVGTLASVKLWVKCEMKDSFSRKKDWLESQLAPTISMIHDGLGIDGWIRFLRSGRERQTPRHISILDEHFNLLRSSVSAAS
ncbi:hypothetical protein FACS189425_10930 [Clostridia bacterium]|nr:hypothetical protein FACS189425_10930 [Clostridia bacterium]